jgi:CubicO group peptidase (beta-lactamase class C family)
MSQVITGANGHNNFQTYQGPPDQVFALETISFIIRAITDAGVRYPGVGIGTLSVGITSSVLAPATGDAGSTIQCNFGLGYVNSVVGITNGWLVTAPLPQLEIDRDAIVWVGSFRQGGGSFPADQIGAVYLQATLEPNDSGTVPTRLEPVTLIPGAAA